VSVFSRRHPFLFFVLVLVTIGAVVIITMTALFLSGKRKAAFDFSDSVGVVEITGVIANPMPVLEALKEMRKNDHVKAIVLRIDSPGGGVGPSQEIYEEIKKTRKTKKVVASMGAIAASGGYYVAAAADHIMANPGTITGSISVIMEFPELKELFRKIGIGASVLKSGRFKDIGSPLRDMTEEERALLQGFIDNVHDQFVEAIVQGRNLSKKEVEAVADGRIFSGAQAKELGLLDSLGNLEDAIALAGKLGGIKGEPSVLFTEKKKFSLWNILLDSRNLVEMLDEMTSAAKRSGYLYSPGR
jgi:protease-4